MSEDREKFKIFVGGLSDQTTDDSFKSYFSTTVGELLDYKVMMTKGNHGEIPRPRGFGFVTFTNQDDYDTCLNRDHVIDNKKVEVKRAVPRSATDTRGAYSGSRCRVKKMFIGGMAPETTKDDIKEALVEEFPRGTTLTVSIMTEKETEKPRGFGFVVCEPPPEESDECIYDAIYTLTQEKKFVKILDRSCELKPAEPKDSMKPAPRKDYGGSRSQQRSYDDGFRYPSRGYEDFLYPRMSYDSLRSNPYGDYYGRSARDYSGYPASSYDRAAAASSYYGDSTYADYYGMMGSGYQQSSSGYGPTRGYSDAAYDTERRDRTTSAYHPYRR